MPLPDPGEGVLPDQPGDDGGPLQNRGGIRRNAVAVYTPCMVLVKFMAEKLVLWQELH